MADCKTTLVLLCRLPTRFIGVPLEHVIETMRPLPVQLLSGAPDCVSGLSVIRGVPVPVVDAGRLIGESETRPGRFVTVRAGDRVVALAVDDVVGVRAILTESLQGLPPLLRDAGAESIAAIGALDGELLLILHSARVVPDDLPESFDSRQAAS
jgi:purine-binding chemotaxis protein CheW